MNAKPAEQAVSRFCIDHLKLKAVCFASFVKASDADMELFRKPVASPPPEYDQTELPGESQPEPEASRETTGSVEKEREIFVRCDPVLDPVSGVAMNDLSAGTHIYGRLAPDSIVYKLLAKNNRNFDGIISAQVSGIAMNNLGTATVSLILSDGIAGVMKLSGKVRVKTSPGPDGAARTRRPSPDSIPPEYIFVGLGFVLAVSAVFMFYYLFLF
jgi:hypothetical protein